MKCFDVVKTVLEATYSEIPGTPKVRDEAIRKALAATSHRYRKELLTEGGPDFSDPVVRFAYVFAYVPSHAHWLHELITWSPEAQAAFEQRKLRITCLGGGPGSDLVGILKFMASHNKEPDLYCELVDGCIQWKSTWSDMAFNLDWERTLHTDYVVHDATDTRTRSHPCKFSRADVFTLSFFVSELTAHQERAEDYLRWALKQAKPGAVVLFNDNNDSRFYGWFDELTAALDFETLLAGTGERKIRDRLESKDIVGHFTEKFGATPKLSGFLAWRVLRKR